LLQPEFSRALVERMYNVGQIFGRAFQLPMTKAAIAFPQFDESSRVNGSRMGGIQVYTEEEATNLQPSSLTSPNRSQKPSFTRNEITANKITGILFVTDELTQDSNALDVWAQNAFSQELTFKFEDLMVNGTGAGQPLGILSSGALITIAKQAGQAAGSIVSSNVIGMMQSLWPPSVRNAVWLYSQEVLPTLFELTTPVGTAGSWLNLFSFASGTDPVNRICGLPAIPSEYCNGAGQVGDLILADFSRYIVGMREMRTDLSIHVMFLSDQNAFRFTLRAGGQPIDARPVTPARNAASPPIQQSPFVALAVRT
jgi:HK97 family phage major capsid protein